MICLVMDLVGADSDSSGKSLLMCSRFGSNRPGIPKIKKKSDVYGLFYTKTHMCAPEWRGQRSVQEKQHKACHTTLWSGHSAHKRKPGNPLLSLLALFPTDLYSLIKTNQGGILHVDSTLHSGELSHLIWMAGSPSLLPVACSKGLTNLIVLPLAWLREGI